MTESEVRRYAQLMRDMGLTALEIDMTTGKVRLECTPAPQNVTVAAPAPMMPGAMPATPLPAAPAVPTLEAPSSAITVNSPIVGVFYVAPMENADPYVKVGDRVKKGDVLCIVEAMKLMNEIVAEQDGVITEICAQNGQLVDFGYTLFKMEAAE